MMPIQMVHQAVREAMVEPERNDWGELAGETIMTLSADRGLETTDSVNLYRCALNHAAIADIVSTAMRKPDDRAWSIPKPPSSTWYTSALIDPTGSHLRRFIAVSHWNEDRELFERRSWFCLGEVAQFKLPMKMVIAVLGHMSGGRRTGYWTKALLHPQRSSLRFKRRSRGTIEGFKETWLPIYREEHAEIERQKWLQAMYEDGVLQESLFVVDVPVPGATELQKITELAKRKLEALQRLSVLPDPQLSTCLDPIAPCPFRVCCHGEPELGPEAGGFDDLRVYEMRV